MDSTEAALEQKFAYSYQQFKREQENSALSGRLEAIALLVFLGLFLTFVEFVFWGEGFSSFASGQHDFTVAFLLDQPGPQADYVEQAIIEKGYISLMDYHRFVEMASRHEISQRNLAALN